MHVVSENIVAHLFRQPSLEKVPLEQVQSMAQKHPSFAIAQFLLLKKMRDEQHPGFTEQLQKTVLYFNNPLWLQFLLNTNNAVYIPLKSPVNLSAEIPTTDRLEDPSLVVSNPLIVAPAHPAVENEVITQNGPAVTPSEHQNNDNTIVPVEDLPASPLTDELKKLAAEIKAAKEILPVMDEKIAAVPAFEPYHTIDYFASQGIKLEKIDQNPQDKLGRQLKSFTEWIKTMKRLPQRDLQKKLEQNDDSKVIADAAVSLLEKEVVTEAMAEVYEKQGMREKASDIYIKLSLLNPDKSHYFAAKIEALKK
jgi:hypothetical protein